MPAGFYVWDGGALPQFDGTVRTSRIIGDWDVGPIQVPAGGSDVYRQFTPLLPFDFAYLAGMYPSGPNYGLALTVNGGVIQIRAVAKPPYASPTNYSGIKVYYGAF